MDGYKKSWDNGPYAKWRAPGTKTIDYRIAPGENHGFWNYSPQWQTAINASTVAVSLRLLASMARRAG